MTEEEAYMLGREHCSEGRTKEKPYDPEAWSMFKDEEEKAMQRRANSAYIEGYNDKKREMDGEDSEDEEEDDSDD